MENVIINLYIIESESFVKAAECEKKIGKDNPENKKT